MLWGWLFGDSGLQKTSSAAGWKLETGETVVSGEAFRILLGKELDEEEVDFMILERSLNSLCSPPPAPLRALSNLLSPLMVPRVS